MSAVEYLADGSGVVGHFGEVSAGGLDRGVAEATSDDVDGHAFAGERGRLEGTQDVRMAEPLRDAGPPAAGQLAEACVALDADRGRGVAGWGVGEQAGEIA